MTKLVSFTATVPEVRSPFGNVPKCIPFLVRCKRTPREPLNVVIALPGNEGSMSTGRVLYLSNETGTEIMHSDLAFLIENYEPVQSGDFVVCIQVQGKHYAGK